MKPGQIVGYHYQLVSKLGEGGMGELWLAQDMRLDRTVVIKRVRKEELDEEKRKDLNRRFSREAKSQARLSCAFIPAVYAFWVEEDGDAVLAMEHVEGCDLQTYLDARKSLPLDEVLQVGIAVGQALQHVHDEGFIHRDLKPANLVVVDGKISAGIRLIDFGVVGIDTRCRDGTRLTNPGDSMGTPAYWPPEEFAGGPYDARSDVYMLAAVLYQLTTGRIPPVHKEVVPLEHPLLWPVLSRALYKDPGKRTGSAAEFVTELRQIQSDLLDNLPQSPTAQVKVLPGSMTCGERVEITLQWPECSEKGVALVDVGKSDGSRPPNWAIMEFGGDGEWCFAVDVAALGLGDGEPGLGVCMETRFFFPDGPPGRPMQWQGRFYVQDSHQSFDPAFARPDQPVLFADLKQLSGIADAGSAETTDWDSRPPYYESRLLLLQPAIDGKTAPCTIRISVGGAQNRRCHLYAQRELVLGRENRFQDTARECATDVVWRLLPETTERRELSLQVSKQHVSLITSEEGLVFRDLRDAEKMEAMPLLVGGTQLMHDKTVPYDQLPTALTFRFRAGGDHCLQARCRACDYGSLSKQVRTALHRFCQIQDASPAPWLLECDYSDAVCIDRAGSSDELDDRESYVMVSGIVTVGSSDDCCIQLLDNEVQPYHGAIVHWTGAYWLVPLEDGISAGQGRPLIRGFPYLVKSGCRFQVGSSQLEIGQFRQVAVHDGGNA